MTEEAITHLPFFKDSINCACMMYFSSSIYSTTLSWIYHICVFKMPNYSACCLSSSKLVSKPSRGFIKVLLWCTKFIGGPTQKKG